MKKLLKAIIGIFLPYILLTYYVFKMFFQRTKAINIKNITIIVILSIYSLIVILAAIPVPDTSAPVESDGPTQEEKRLANEERKEKTRKENEERAKELEEEAKREQEEREKEAAKPKLDSIEFVYGDGSGVTIYFNADGTVNSATSHNKDWSLTGDSPSDEMINDFYLEIIKTKSAPVKGNVYDMDKLDWDKLIGDDDEESETPELTREQENAIGSASDYISFLSFSRKGLIDQLVYEGFSKTDATFAVDYIVVDWNEECLEAAKDYLDLMSFSKQGLKDQLAYEGYTQSQIDYAINILY